MLDIDSELPYLTGGFMGETTNNIIFPKYFQLYIIYD